VLQVLDEDPVVGRERNRLARRGCFDAFPEYVTQAAAKHVLLDAPSLTSAESSENQQRYVLTASSGSPRCRR